ncbi:MAG TPA: lipoprotein insertase outer membrane protein LolB [Nitrosospira sp.]
MNNAGVEPLQSMRFIFPWWSLFLCAPPFFAGCALVPPAQKNNVASTVFTEPVSGAADSRSASFLMAGRIAVKGGKESFSGGVQWRHAEEGDEILLLSPLGQTLAQIQLNTDGAFLTTSEHQTYYAADVESLTEKVLGWDLPLAGLQYWVQGVNSPLTASEIDLDAGGRAVAIRQDGWDIDYSSYFSASALHVTPAQAQTQTQAQIPRPRSLRLKRGELQIKFIVDAWSPDGN